MTPEVDRAWRVKPAPVERKEAAVADPSLDVGSKRFELRDTGATMPRTGDEAMTIKKLARSPQGLMDACAPCDQAILKRL